MSELKFDPKLVAERALSELLNILITGSYQERLEAARLILRYWGETE